MKVTGTKRLKSGLMAAALALPMLAPIGAVPAHAQYEHRDQNGDRGQYRGNHQNFYNGAYNGGRGGSYGDERDPNRRYQTGNGYYQNGQYHPNGIGPGKGAAIGAAGGAALGAVFGGGLKGALVGGAAGAGIGAIAGKAHQDDQRRDQYDNRYPR